MTGASSTLDDPGASGTPGSALVTNGQPGEDAGASKSSRMRVAVYFSPARGRRRRVSENPGRLREV